MLSALFRSMDTHRTQSEAKSQPTLPGRPRIERLTLTVDEVAVALGISRSSAYECAKRGEIPTVRFGRRIVVPRNAVLALLGESDTES
jgi:excisionase family DNA binding protein